MPLLFPFWEQKSNERDAAAKQRNSPLDEARRQFLGSSYFWCEIWRQQAGMPPAARLSRLLLPAYQPIFQVPDCKRFEGWNRQISHQKYDDPCPSPVSVACPWRPAPVSGYGVCPEVARQDHALPAPLGQRLFGQEVGALLHRLLRCRQSPIRAQRIPSARVPVIE